jgi:hypothetical protein
VHGKRLQVNKILIYQCIAHIQWLLFASHDARTWGF